MSIQFTSVITRRWMKHAFKQIRLTNHTRVQATQLRCLSDDSSEIAPIRGNIPTRADENLRNNIAHETEAAAEEESYIYDRDFVDHKVSDFEALYKDDPTGDTKSQIETILEEYEHQKYNSMGRVPSVINSLDMIQLLNEGPTPSARLQVFNFFFKREMDKRASKLRRERDKAKTAERYQARIEELSKVHGNHRRTGLTGETGSLLYGLWHNSMFCRLADSKMKQAKSTSRLCQAAVFGPTLIFDFDFEDYMNAWIRRNVVEQIQEAYGLNRYNYHEPFDMWFCNFNKDSPNGIYTRERVLPNLYTTSMITVKSDCFTNYFDKSRLVYLTPNSKVPLTNVGRNDDVYIVGAYNDKGGAKPLTYRKAEKLGIRSRCLPIDSNLAWQGSSKSLCVNHVTGILLEVMASGGNWQKAFLKHIPPRKIKPAELVIEEEKLRLAKLERKRGSFKKFNIKEDLDLR